MLAQTQDRLPPNSPESERGILGSILDAPEESLARCMEHMPSGPETFYDLRNRMIYESMMNISEAKKPIDVITLIAELGNDRLAEAGGVPYLCSLQDDLPSAANLPYYIETANEMLTLRKVIKTCAEIGAIAYEHPVASELLDQFEKTCLSIRPSKTGEKDIKTLVDSAIEKMEEVWRNKGAITGFPTGLIDLDRLTYGLHLGEVTVLAGFPGTGKTSMAMNIAEKAMLDLGMKVGVFSLEMTAESLVRRFICSHARINMRDIANNLLTPEAFVGLSRSASAIKKASIYFNDDSDMSVYQLRAKCRRMKQDHGLDFVIIDYMQLLTASGGVRKVESRQQEVADISRGIKGMARELNIPVLALSQLNDDGKLRESRAIGQDSDNVWVLCVEEDEDLMQMELPVTLRVNKSRNGPIGAVELLFRKRFTRFESVSKIDQKDIPKITPLPETRYKD